MARTVGLRRSYEAKAVPWARGWELHVPGVGVTQVRVLADAEGQVRDLVETMTGSDASGVTVTIRYDLNGLESELQTARGLTEQAAQLQLVAAEANRGVVERLRARGLSVTDIASLMGVSRGRVSQYLAARAATPGAQVRDR